MANPLSGVEIPGRAFCRLQFPATVGGAGEIPAPYTCLSHRQQVVASDFRGVGIEPVRSAGLWLYLNNSCALTGRTGLFRFTLTFIPVVPVLGTPPFTVTDTGSGDFFVAVTLGAFFTFLWPGHWVSPV